jgi:hypothetical protein
MILASVPRERSGEPLRTGGGWPKRIRRVDAHEGRAAPRSDEPPAAPPQLAPGSPFSVMPGPGLRLVRRWARWSTGSRFLIAVVLSALALPAAFPLVQDVSRWWFIWLAVLIWQTSIGRLFVPWERITGMWCVRREVWLRRATESPDGWIVVLDGRERRIGEHGRRCGRVGVHEHRSEYDQYRFVGVRLQ